MSMAEVTDVVRRQLAAAGIETSGHIHRNLPPAELVARSLARGEGLLAANGALAVKTGQPSGRAPLDRFIVNSGEAARLVDWSDVNQPCEPAVFDHLLRKSLAYLGGCDLYTFDGFSGADPAHQMPIRVVTDATWHALFADRIFVRPTAADLDDFTPEFTVIDAGSLHCNPAVDGTRSHVFIGIDFGRKLVLILGTMYAGELKKTLFAAANYLLPARDVLPMHCAANVGDAGDVALFFGLSGTGKTTLSTEPTRRLIGDDEHGWSADSVFNFEGGCYAKTIRLSPQSEPQIHDAIRFGSILENVAIDPFTRVVDYDSDAITENGRATYPIDYIPGAVIEGVGAHPKNVFFLTTDAFGVLPPIAKLTPDMAQYHFLSGFTSKVAGTETGIVDPVPTFSACFGAPFMPLHPCHYSKMLAERLARHGTDCWLVNTGWSGGAFGTGRRMSIETTRGLIAGALDGSLGCAELTPHPVFKVLVPNRCGEVDPGLLDPRASWSDKAAYDETARMLAGMFRENFKQYERHVTPEVLAAGPDIPTPVA